MMDCYEFARRVESMWKSSPYTLGELRIARVKEQDLLTGELFNIVKVTISGMGEYGVLLEDGQIPTEIAEHTLKKMEGFFSNPASSRELDMT